MSALQQKKVTKLPSSYVSAHEQQEKKTAKRKRVAIIRFTFFGVLLSIVAALFLYVIHSQSVNMEAKVREQKRLEQRLESLEKKQKRLEQEIKKLHDDEYIAELARKKYYLSKEGEIIFAVPGK
ncbi:cell division protein DivIC [Anoxybacillus voinovskiensis]|uniref:Cell division protein DivIC n=1 Tax=Anoxybacteroides voinovskiense TaxID=230470 RepID=A0A840DYG2_9BACL|nr:septum formation initiator family protein [Anoxybacillus voinovskiensis]MBB4075008.1 cell division protein DivIC [Anoxybacillus voinovskiensis]GGJ75661.1 cell division protein DIVIC [Anoxybacillus voinovskiensis]